MRFSLYVDQLSKQYTRLTWMFFQQLKRTHEEWLGYSPSGEVSFGFGAVAAAASVTVMIPMDTVKTRIVTQVILKTFRVVQYFINRVPT